MSTDLDTTLLGFGKYHDKTPDQVGDIDPQYIVWMYENVKPIRCSKELYESCEQDLRDFDDDMGISWNDFNNS